MAGDKNNSLSKAEEQQDFEQVQSHQYSIQQNLQDKGVTNESGKYGTKTSPYDQVMQGGNKPRALEQKWTLTTTEEEFKVPIVIIGQFPVDDLQLNTVGGIYSDITSVNQSSPITQWIRGQLETITLTSEFFAEHSEDNIDLHFETLLRLARRDEVLMRPPICMFTFGTKLARTCFVEHVANIAFGPLRPDGTPQRIRFTLTLRCYTPSMVKTTDPSDRPHDSRLRQAKTGDTYESIAADEYGDPLVGEYLRRFHGYRPDLVEGDVVHILTVETIARKGGIVPQSDIAYSMTVNPKFAAVLFGARSGGALVP